MLGFKPWISSARVASEATALPTAPQPTVLDYFSIRAFFLMKAFQEL